MLRANTHNMFLRKMRLRDAACLIQGLLINDQEDSNPDPSDFKAHKPERPKGLLLSLK